MDKCTDYQDIHLHTSKLNLGAIWALAISFSFLFLTYLHDKVIVMITWFNYQPPPGQLDDKCCVCLLTEQWQPIFLLLYHHWLLSSTSILYMRMIIVIVYCSECYTLGMIHDDVGWVCLISNSFLYQYHHLSHCSQRIIVVPSLFSLLPFFLHPSLLLHSLLIITSLQNK